MKNLLAIGNAASTLVGQLSSHSVYNCYYVANQFKKTSKYKFALEEMASPEEYENMHAEKLLNWVEKIQKDVTVFVNGASETTAITLRALEPLYRKGLKIEVIYVLPELEVLSHNQSLHERTARGVLQNYARSGVFEKICMVSNLNLEEIAGSTNVYEYFEQIGSVFTSSYYMMDVFKNTTPIISTFKKPKESCRITTIGLSTLDCEDKMFFPLDNVLEKRYYFGINEEKLKTQENLFRTITNNIKERIKPEQKVSFGIYPTKYSEDYIYVEHFSPKIQNFPLDKENQN